MEIKEKIDELLKAKENVIALLNNGDALVDFKDLAFWASEVVRLRHEIRGLL